MYARFVRWIGDKPWFRPFARRGLAPVDRLLLKWGLRATPWDTLLLTTTGRRTGRSRRVPLYYVEHGDDLAVIASNYGGPEPRWSQNLEDDPSCRVNRHRRETPATARRAAADEWEPIFERFADFYPGYRAYRERANRDIPIWILQAATRSR